MRIPRFLLPAIIALLVLSLPGWPARSVHGLGQPVSTVQISPVQTCCLTNNFFTVNVILVLPAGESITGFDIRINYTDPYSPTNPQGVLQAQANSISYSNNLFGSASSTVIVDCIDGTSYGGSSGCPKEDAPLGQFHLSEVVTGTGVSGPLSGILFSVRFTVKGLGESVFAIDRADLVNPHPDPSNPQLVNPVFIPVVRQDGVFGNTGVVAFFNYQPSDTSVSTAIIPNQPDSFDASASFLGNGSSVSFRLYSWNFGDRTGVSNVTVGPTNTHMFRVPGNYTVSLTVWDQKNETGRVARTVDVLPALGSLSLTVEDERGTVMRGNVVVRVFNTSSSAPPFVEKAVGGDGTVQFNMLTPSDSYYLTFSGDTVENYSKTESVQPGLTSRDTVFLTLKPPPPDYSGIIYLGTILGGLSIVAGAIIYKRRSFKTGSSNHSGRKAKTRKITSR